MNRQYTPVRRFFDLAQFGIGALTGEACAYGMRMLCDVNEEGRALLAEYLGQPDPQLAERMNSSVDNKPSVGSIMLPHDIVQSLAQFAFFRAGALAVLKGNNEVNGIFEPELLASYRAQMEKYPNCGYAICSNHTLHSSHPRVGSRNVHAMTGRVM